MKKRKIIFKVQPAIYRWILYSRGEKNVGVFAISTQNKWTWIWISLFLCNAIFTTLPHEISIDKRLICLPAKIFFYTIKNTICPGYDETQKNEIPSTNSHVLGNITLDSTCTNGGIMIIKKNLKCRNAISR